jgi:hypothetical protein
MSAARGRAWYERGPAPWCYGLAPWGPTRPSFRNPLPGVLRTPPVLRTAYYVRNRPLFPVTGRHSAPVCASAQQYIRNKPSFRTAQGPGVCGAGREYPDNLTPLSLRLTQHQGPSKQAYRNR